MDEQVARDILRRLDRLERGAVKLRKGVVSAVSPLSIQAGGETDNPYTDVASAGAGGFALNGDVVFLTAGHSLLALGTPGKRTPQARVHHDTGQPITGGVETTLAFNNTGGTPVIDTDGMWSAAANTRLTVNTPGAYVAFASVQWASSAGAGVLQTFIRRNGTTAVAAWLLPQPAVASTPQLTISSAPYPCVAGDYFEVRVNQTRVASPGTLAVVRNVDNSPIFGVVRTGDS